MRGRLGSGRPPGSARGLPFPEWPVAVPLGSCDGREVALPLCSDSVGVRGAPAVAGLVGECWPVLGASRPLPPPALS